MSRQQAIGKLLLGLVFGVIGLSTHASDDWVLFGGHIYTAEQTIEQPEAVVVRNGRITHVGSLHEAKRLASSDAEWIDTTGKMVMPGFHDAHIHTRLGGRSLTGCDVAMAPDLEQLTEMLRGCFSSTDEPWLIAEGLNLGFFGQSGPELPWMNAINSDKPMLLRASDGHSVSINSVAMRLANITVDTETPEAGVIERDALGRPTGTLRESAMALADRVVPRETLEDRLHMASVAVKEMNRLGITSAFDAWVGSEDIDVYRSLDDQGMLTVRIRAALAYGRGDLFTLDSPDDYERLLANRAELSTERFKLAAVKLFIDGVLEGETAALVSPYLSDEGGSGHLTYSQAYLNTTVTELASQGVQVYTHAVGDGGVRSILDAFEAAEKALGETDLRHQISHLQLIHPDDYHRFAELGVVANFQALWALPDEWIMNLNLPVVGMDRVQRMYPIASMVEAGATIVGGSDWNISSLNPLEAIEVALLRQDWIANDELTKAEVEQLDTLNRSERVDLDTMLRAYTSTGAWAMHQDQETGTLSPGKRADLIVLSHDLFSTEPQSISTVEVEKTFLDGKLVYQKP